MFDSVTDFVMEIVLFLQRLVSRGLYGTGVALHMTLHNVENRHLIMSDPRATPFYTGNYAVH
jgi:hypothetical protein